MFDDDLQDPTLGEDVRAPGALRLLALAAVSCGLLAFQIALTKIFSIVLWYHFGFLVISIALLGFAMAGVWLSRRPRLLDDGAALLARLSGGASLATTVVIFIVTHVQVDAYSFIQDHDEGSMLLLIGVLLIPFFFMGAAVSATLTLHRARAGITYSANLVGSGLGCVAAIGLFDLLHLSAPEVVISSSLLIALGGLAFALDGGLRGITWPVVAIFAAIGSLALVQRFPDAMHLVAPPSKPLHHVEKWDRENKPKEAFLLDGTRIVFSAFESDPADPTQVIVYTPDGPRTYPLDQFAKDETGQYIQRPTSLVRFTEWTSLSRVDAFDWPSTLPSWGWWGLSSEFRGERPKQKGITIDSWAMTNIVEWKREAGEAPPEMLEYLPASLCHRVKPDADILCIGAGGGMDLLTAMRFDASRVTGVEINPGVVRAAKYEPFLQFQGRLYDPEVHPHVSIHVAEGRHWLETDDHLYDVVQLSGVDTYSTTQAGAFSLSENFLYTAEAFDTYLSHTKPDGLVTLTRWVVPQEDGLARNTLRLFVLAWEALERAGIEDPTRHVYLVESQFFSVILFGRTPFTDEQLATLDAACEQYAYDPLFHPAQASPWNHWITGDALDNPWEQFARAQDKEAWLAEYPYDVASPTDDRPFFFETVRFENLWKYDSFFNRLGGITAHGILLILLIIVAVAGFFFVLLPTVRMLRASGDEHLGERPVVPTLIYFGCLGLGFIFVEVVLSQQFILYLGNPLYSLSVVLFSVLLFSGLGSALSSKVAEPRKALLVVILLAAVYPWFTELVFDATLQLPTAARIALSVGLLAPLATAMGMPFPLGVGRIASGGTDLVAWAWGINGYTSVVGSVVTVILSMTFGFDAVVWIGAGVYALAFLVAPRLLRGTGL